jgi:hypothetical protein
MTLRLREKDAKLLSLLVANHSRVLATLSPTTSAGGGPAANWSGSAVSPCMRRRLRRLVGVAAAHGDRDAAVRTGAVAVAAAGDPNHCWGGRVGVPSGFPSSPIPIGAAGAVGD